MSNVEHNVIDTVNIHPMPGLGPYANEAARLTAGALLGAQDVNKCAFQTDTGALWSLVAAGGVGVWVRMGGPMPVHVENTTARTYGINDADCFTLFMSASVSAGTIPLNASVGFPIGTELQAGSGAACLVSFVAASGVGFTLPTDRTAQTRVAGCKISARKVGTDQWLISGDLAASAAFSGNFGALFPACWEYRRGDLGLHTTGSAINSWDNQVSGAGTIVEKNAGVGIGVAGPGLGGKGTVLVSGGVSGTAQGGLYTAPAGLFTTPVLFYMLQRQTVTSSSGTPQVIGACESSFNFGLYEDAGSNTIVMYGDSGYDKQPGATLAWARIAAYFDGTTANFLKWGNLAPVTGTVTQTASYTGNMAFGYTYLSDRGNNGETALTLKGPVSGANVLAQIATLDTAAISWFGSGNFLS